MNVNEIIDMKVQSEKLARDALKGARKIVRHYYVWRNDDWHPKNNIKNELKSYRLWYKRMKRKYAKIDEHEKFMESIFTGVFRVPRKSKVLLAKLKNSRKYYSMTEEGLKVNECGWLTSAHASDIDGKLEVIDSCPLKWRKYCKLLSDLSPVSKLFQDADGCADMETLKNIPVMDADVWEKELEDTLLRIVENAEVLINGDGVEIDNQDVDGGANRVNGAITYVMNKEVIEAMMKKREAHIDELIKKMDVAKKELTEKHKRALLIASC